MDDDELEMIESVMEFADTQAGEIMTPRTDIFALQANADFLTACFALAGELLDRQYRLTAEQESELLGFASDELPEWIPQLLRWAQGMPTEAPAFDPLLAMAMAEPEAASDTDTPDGP